ncbi:hypothetical protein KQI52_08320 [bacterium]|nr:hypothetical protein [bacterium]
MGIIVLIIVCIVILVAFSSMQENDSAEHTPNIGGLIGLIVVAGILLATCASCG